jgi:uncharacterized RDD family membrane protein YckC
LSAVAELPTRTRATLRQRVIGRAVDMTLLCVLLVGALSGFVSTDANGNAHFDVPPLFLVALIVAVFAFETVPVRLRGQTPGKILMKTRVVRASDGGRPSWRAAFTRWGVVVVVLVVLGGLYPPAGLAATAALYATALMDPNGRGVVDKLAGTEVVQAT